MNFRDYIRDTVLKKGDRILEFGPLNWPIVTKDRFPNAYYSDIRNSDDIKKLYTSNDYLKSTGISIDVDTIVDIDYVVNGTYKDSFKGVEKFDVVVLSHVIEHIPNILLFFQDVLNVLKKDGKLVIIYPDARYCFDHFRNGTTFIDAYEVYKSGAINSRAVFDFTYNVVHENRPAFFWDGKDAVGILPKNKFDDALKSYEKSSANELPDDVHFWPFSDYQFIKFLYDMDRAGLLGLEISYFHETQQNTQEFMVVLRPKKTKSLKYDKYRAILSQISPVVRAGAALKERQALADQIVQLEKAAEATKQELKEIHDSKKWRLIKKAATIKQTVFGSKHSDT